MFTQCEYKMNADQITFINQKMYVFFHLTIIFSSVSDYNEKLTENISVVC